MKKVLFALLPAMFLFSSIKTHASWELCHYSVQTSIDSWDLYIKKTWVGSGFPINDGVYQYSYDLHQWNFTIHVDWTNLPSNGYIGSVGLGTSITNILVRKVDVVSIPAPPPVMVICGPCA